MVLYSTMDKKRLSSYQDCEGGRKNNYVVIKKSYYKIKFKISYSLTVLFYKYGESKQNNY